MSETVRTFATRARTGLRACLVSACVVAASAGVAAQWRTLPRVLDACLANDVRLTPDERDRLAGGALVTTVLESEVSAEVAVFGAVWVNAPAEGYVAHVRDIQRFEPGSVFKQTRRFSASPDTDDVAELRLTREALDELRRCRVGRCGLKLPADAITQLQARVDWSRATAADEAQAWFREWVVRGVREYQARGNDALAVYQDGSRTTSVAEELRSLVALLPPLTPQLGAIRSHLLEFPHTPLPQAENIYYWQEAQFGLKPTLRVHHLSIFQQPGETVVVSKLLYATHYFWTDLEFTVLREDPARGPGFWLLTISRNRADGLSGLTGRFVRQQARSEVLQRTAAVLRDTKAHLERDAASRR